MSRHEADREDLLREATALVQRAELQFDGDGESLVIGFRRDGAASVFFGQQFVLQFNAANELRRGFFAGRLLKAERGRLVALTRVREADAVQLVRHELDSHEMAEFLALATEYLAQLRARLTNGEFRLIGEVPTDGDCLGRIRLWLDSLPNELPIATAPNASRRGH